MTARTIRGWLTVAVLLVASTAGAQVKATPVRPTRVAPPGPVLSQAQRRLPVKPLRPTVSTPASDSYRNERRAVQHEVLQQARPSLGALAAATRKSPPSNTPRLVVAPPDAGAAARHP